jgi:hypothetical protein
MHIAAGDGGNGEQTSSVRSNPQRLDMLVGKILRIVPDIKEHIDRSTVSDNKRYRIPNDNPFASKSGARKEIWAYGLRNPHRLTWDVDPSNRANNHLIALVIGLHTWETVDIIHKGANYGYSLREGPQQLNGDNSLSSPPENDVIPVQIDATKTDGTVHPTYPVIAYGHSGTPASSRSRMASYTAEALCAARRQIPVRRHYVRPHLVGRDERDAGGRRWRSEDDGRDARRQDRLERQRLPDNGAYQ